MPREVLLSDLKAVNGLVDTNVYEARLRIDLPCARIRHLSVVRSSQISDLNQLIFRDELARLLDALGRPESGRNEHALPRGFEADQILHNSRVLISSTALIQHDRVRVRHVQEGPDLLLRHI